MGQGTRAHPLVKWAWSGHNVAMGADTRRMGLLTERQPQEGTQTLATERREQLSCKLD